MSFLPNGDANIVSLKNKIKLQCKYLDMQGWGKGFFFQDLFLLINKYFCLERLKGLWPGTVAYTCNPSTLGGRGG